MKKNNLLQSTKLTPLVLALGVLLTGCATTQHATSPQHISDPKQTLSDAVQSQLKSSFGYQTTVSVSVPKSDDVATDATPSCEQEHDVAYIELLKSAKDDYARIASDSITIKEAYLACVNDKMSVNQYKPFDFEKFYQENRSLESSELEQKFIDELHQHALSQNDALSMSTPQHDPQAAKKAKLLDEYLIKPAKITVKGNYQPLAGVITAIPEARYTAKNLNSAINQPIYIDLKSGVMYLWADNIGLFQGIVLDKELGDKWKDKWLAFSLNDGSLPPEFAKDFIKSYLKAKKESFLALDGTHMRQVDAQSVLDLPNFAKNLDDNTQQIITNSQTIIQNTPDNKSLAYSRYVFADTLYNDLTTKYPQLADGEIYREYDIIDGESHVNVSTPIRQTAEPSDDADTPTTPQINSQKFITLILNVLKSQVNQYYHVKLPNQDEYTKEPPVWHYGINNGKISWLHHRTRFQMVNQIKHLTANSSNDPIYIDTLTLIEPRTKHELDRLPSHVRTPNAANSIDAFAYGNEFIKKFTNNNPYLPISPNVLLGTPTTFNDLDGVDDLGDEYDLDLDNLDEKDSLDEVQ
ncbi:MAG: hypothetical protein Q4B81_03355 [Moraxella sp.]|nr:hypothetical protein [Moraxella sp.]